MRLDRRSATERGPFYLRSYDQQAIEMLAGLIEPGTSALDIGANVGFFTIPLGIHVQSQEGAGRVYAFEPVPSNYDRLRDNVALNNLGDTVTIVSSALSSKAGVAQISLREDFEGGAVTGNAAIVINSDDERFATATTTISRLDDYAAKMIETPISVIKMDTEGHEDEVFAGGRETITRNRPAILMEVAPEYYDRKGVDLYEQVRAALPLDYRFLAIELGRQSVMRPLGTRLSFREIHDRSDFMRPQDVLLVPPERRV